MRTAPFGVRSQLNTASCIMTHTPTITDRNDSSPDDEYVVIGGGPLATSVARELDSKGHTVTVVDEALDPSELPGQRGNPEDLSTLEKSGLGSATTAIVGTRSDRRNLLIAQLARAHFDVANILVLTNTPSRNDVVESAGHTPICATTVLADAIATEL